MRIAPAAAELWSRLVMACGTAGLVPPLLTLPVAAQKAAAADPWEAEIQAFEQADRANPPAPGGVLFLGSSSIRMWETLAEDFAGVPVVKRGFGGAEISVERTVTEPRVRIQSMRASPSAPLMPWKS